MRSNWKLTSALLCARALVLEREARVGWCLVWHDGGDKICLWAPYVFHVALFISQGTVQVPESQAKTILTNGTRGYGIYAEAFLRRLSKYFKTQSKTKPLIVMSVSLPKVALSCFQQASERIIQTQDLDCASEGMAQEQA